MFKEYEFETIREFSIERSDITSRNVKKIHK